MLSHFGLESRRVIANEECDTFVGRAFLQTRPGEVIFEELVQTTQ